MLMMQLLRISPVVLPFSCRLSRGRSNELVSSIWSNYPVRHAATSATFPKSLTGVNFYIDQNGRANIPNAGLLAGDLSTQFMNNTFGLFKDGTKPFLKSVKMTLNPNFYKFNFGLFGDAMVKLTNFNNNAFQTLCEMTLGDNKDPLCKIQATTEITENRQVQAISDDISKELNDSKVRNDLDDNLIDLQELGLPTESIMSSSVRVRPSDIDENNTVNWSTMLSFCQHSINSAILSKKLQTMKRKSTFSQIKELHLDVTKDVFLDDTIDISVYENVELNRILFVGMRQEDIVCKGYMDINPEMAGELRQWQLPIRTKSNVCVNFESPAVGFRRDRFNNAVIEHAKSLIAHGRLNSFLGNGYLRGHTLDAIQVIFTHRVKINPKFYEIQQSDNLEHTLELVNLGNTSFMVHTTLTRKDQVFMSVLSNIVNFNTRKGKAEPFSDWHKETFSDYCNKVKPLEVIPPAKIPKDTHKYSIDLRYDDLDYHVIVTNSRYATFCFDAAAHAIFTKSSAYYTGFTYDFNPKCVKEFDICYMDQCRENQRLDVYSYQDREDPQKLHFLLMKGDKKICYCNMTIDLNSSEV